MSLRTRLGSRVRRALYLDRDSGASDAEYWRIGVMRIAVMALLGLCLAVIAISSADAWRTHNYASIALRAISLVALATALRIVAQQTRRSAVLVMVLIYLVGLWVLTGVRDASMTQLGMVLLYAAPQIALIGCGVRCALLLMALNCIPLVWLLSVAHAPVSTGHGEVLPHSQIYIHLLLFLLFNVATPLAFLFGFEALKRSAVRFQRANRQLRKNNILYEDMFEHAGGAALICSRGGDILKANRGAVVLFECELAETHEPLLLGDLLEAQPLGLQLEALLQLACSSGSSEGEFVMRGAAAAGREVMLRAKSLSPRCLLIGIRDISHLRTTQRELRAIQAAHDRLVSFDQQTSLPNREYLRERLRELMKRHARDGNDGLLAVACIRLNSIRSVNEKYGQSVGDELICEFGRELSLRAGPQVLPARLRGAVFSLLISDYHDQERLLWDVERIVAGLPSHCEAMGKPVELSMSVGLAFARGADIAVSELIYHSERALEAARRTPQRRVVVFSEDIGQEFHREIEVEIALSAALQSGELALAYQPKVDASRRIQGLEALLRWHSAELGDVSPAEFIPIAERNGKIHAITDFVVDSVCRQQREWLSRYGIVWPVAVNLSAIDLLRGDIATMIVEALQRHELKPEHLELEITETGLIEDDEIALGNLTQLAQAGFHIAIDDFGTGYSSLKKLSAYPVHTIKIDRDFVLSIGENPRSEQIVRLILALARFLNCNTVAEGVEGRDQFQFLLDNGCKRFQGYMFYRPLPAAEIDVLLADAH